MERVNYVYLSVVVFIGLTVFTLGTSSLYESYIEGRIIYHAVSPNTSVLIGNDSCFTSIYDDTINFTCGGKIANLDTYYAGMFYHNHTATELTFTEADVYYPLFFTNDMNNGFTSNNLGLSQPTNVTCDVSGSYLVNYMAVGYGVNNHEYHLVIFVNDDEIEKCETFQKMSATGDFVTMSGSCVISLNEGDDVSLRIADYTTSSICNYNIGNLVLVRVGNKI